ncbi:MAG: hypothetical protein K2O44_02920 [Clostridia bacterium]|nr:hypothetical protein [Clostridia bacterium]
MGKYVFGPERTKGTIKSEKKTARNLIITFSVLLVFFVLVFSIAATFLPQGIADLKEEQYLSRNGVEVEAVLVGYTVTEPGKTPRSIKKWHLNLIYEYESPNGRIFKSVYGDDWCDTHSELLLRESEVKTMIKGGHTAKMMVADNGRCKLKDDGPSIAPYSHFWAALIPMLIAAIIMVGSILGIVQQVKVLKRYKAYDV